eukprot:227569-Chlamydomonas_euryale.AAC.1
MPRVLQVACKLGCLRTHARGSGVSLLATVLRMQAGRLWGVRDCLCGRGEFGRCCASPESVTRSMPRSRSSCTATSRTDRCYRCAGGCCVRGRRCMIPAWRQCRLRSFDAPPRSLQRAVSPLIRSWGQERMVTHAQHGHTCSACGRASPAMPQRFPSLPSTPSLDSLL